MRVQPVGRLGRLNRTKVRWLSDDGAVYFEITRSRSALAVGRASAPDWLTELSAAAETGTGPGTVQKSEAVPTRLLPFAVPAVKAPVALVSARASTSTMTPMAQANGVTRTRRRRRPLVSPP